MQEKKHIKPLIFLGIFGSAISAIFIRNANTSPFINLFYRYLFILLILFLPVVIKHKKKLIAAAKENFKLLFIISILQIAVMVFWILAINNTTIVSATIISNSHPVIVVIVSGIFLNHKYDYRAIIGVSLSVVAFILLSISDFNAQESYLVGNVFAFLASTFWAFYLMLVNQVRKKLDTDVFMFLMYIFTFVFAVTIILIRQENVLAVQRTDLIAFFNLALFSSVIGQGLVDWGLLYVSASFASLSFLIEPLYSIVLSIFFANEIPTVAQIFFGSLLLLGIYIYDRYEIIHPN